MEVGTPTDGPDPSAPYRTLAAPARTPRLVAGSPPNMILARTPHGSEVGSAAQPIFRYCAGGGETLRNPLGPAHFKRRAHKHWRNPPQPNRITYATPPGTWHGASKTL